jgi:hypothetical protein
LLSKYEVADVGGDTETHGTTNTTHRVSQKGVPSEVRNTLNVLKQVPGIMDDYILDNVTDEEINSLREAVEYVWSVVGNEAEMNINSSLVKTYHNVNRSTAGLMPDINSERSKRQTTEVALGQQAEIYKSVGSQLGFIIRNVTLNNKNGQEKKISSLVTGTDRSPQDTRNFQEEGNLL